MTLALPLSNKIVSAVKAAGLEYSKMYRENRKHKKFIDGRQLRFWLVKDVAGIKEKLQAIALEHNVELYIHSSDCGRPNWTVPIVEFRHHV